MERSDQIAASDSERVAEWFRENDRARCIADFDARNRTANALRANAETKERTDAGVEKQEALTRMRSCVGILLPKSEASAASRERGCERRPADTGADDGDIDMSGRGRPPILVRTFSILRGHPERSVRNAKNQGAFSNS
ncbi:MAG: hypothetical protein KJS97_16070 [Alphaproteobacteria bacterium]|nr:hypothetical protein [Alphaproteobacteria bacterium]